jgi:hypothetical protein
VTEAEVDGLIDSKPVLVKDWEMEVVGEAENDCELVVVSDGEIDNVCDIDDELETVIDAESEEDGVADGVMVELPLAEKDIDAVED